MHLPLVRYVARSYADRGENFDDLVQVGTIGLINAIDRFEPERGLEFSTYAAPTIAGEIKRHFRDRTGSVRVPHRIQELRTPVRQAREDLTNELHRVPTSQEIADRLGIEPDEVVAVHASTIAAFALPLEGESEFEAIGISEEDEDLAAIDDREALRPLLATLPERERRMITLRFKEKKTQAQIAELLGISQMHVSRMLERTLAQLRQGLTAE